jgi:uncharacterized protein (TIRG00374 family)
LAGKPPAEVLHEYPSCSDGYEKRLLNTQTILRGLRIALGLILLVFALQDANWIELQKSLKAANLTWVLLALGVVVIGLVLKIWRWSTLLHNFGLKNPFRLVSEAFLAGQAANILLPIRGGELIRIGMMEKGEADNLARLAGTIAVEKFLDLLALTGLTLLVLPSLRSIDSHYGSPEYGYHYILQGLAVFSIAAIAFIVVYVLWAPRLWSVIQRKIQSSHPRWIVRSGEVITQFVERSVWLRDWRKISSSLLITLVIWCLMWATNLLAFQSVSLRADPLMAGLVLMLVYIGLIPALMPGNIGPFYFFAQLALRAFDIPLDQALAFAILLHAVVTLPVLVIGGVILLLSNRQLRRVRSEDQ